MDRTTCYFLVTLLIWSGTPVRNRPSPPVPSQPTAFIRDCDLGPELGSACRAAGVTTTSYARTGLFSSAGNGRASWKIEVDVCATAHQANVFLQALQDAILATARQNGVDVLECSDDQGNGWTLRYVQGLQTGLICVSRNDGEPGEMCSELGQREYLVTVVWEEGVWDKN
jgi:hypothetical protein